MTDQDLEKQIVARGLTAPRVTEESIDGLIASEQYHQFPGTTVTICCLNLSNGYSVTGESACVSSANFNLDLGMKIARANARNKIWQLEGYLLRHNLNNLKTGISEGSV